MFDVFYSGMKPNQFAHEREADSIEHARKLCRTRYFWWITYLADYSTHDWDFQPAPWQSEYTHTWPSQHHKYSGTCLVPKSGEINYHFHDRIIPNKSSTVHFYTAMSNAEFDYSWAPHPHDPPYIYVFGNQWWPAEIMPTVEYHVPGATERKYMSMPKAELAQNPNRPWYNVIDSDMDYSWVPDPGDPPYIYVFGNQWWPAEIMPTVEYRMPGATERKYVAWPRAKLVSNLQNWTVPLGIDVAEFDFSWIPDPGNPPYVYQFGTQHQRTGGPVYSVPGATEVKYVNYPRAVKIVKDPAWTVPDSVDTAAFDWTWHPDATEPPYVYQFGTQWQRTGGPVYSVPGATEVKYVNYPRAVKIVKDSAWTVPDGVDTSTFDWTWHPDATEPPYVYQFGTQHQRTGGPVYSVATATEVKYVDQIRIKTDATTTVIYEIDHLDGNAGQIPNTVKRVRYFDNYRDTLIRLAKSIGPEHEYVWVCSSVCDYTKFDFSWHPEQWQATMLHVFSSDEQKFGDTFFMHVPTFVDRAESRALLEWYDVNFVSNMAVPRRALPVQQHTDDSHVDTVRQLQTHAPLTLIVNGAIPHKIPAVNLWRAETKTAVPLNKSGSVLIVPREAVVCVKTQLYDYPLIDKTHRSWLSDQSMDVIFISNGESMANQNWQHLKSICPRARRSDGVNGRELAYKTAAELSSTPWFYAVFAKTEVFDTFKFDYQPDWLQQPKHYIFHSHNPLNGLEYGAMNVNLYNRQLVLDTQPGIDFTLSAAHEVVPICISVSRFNTDPWVTWRSAFREVLKLQLEVHQGADVEIQYRLNTWLTVAQGHNAEWCLAGGQDAVQYYKTVGGDYEKLQLSFDWQWLQDYYYSLYKTTPWLEL